MHWAAEGWGRGVMHLPLEQVLQIGCCFGGGETGVGQAVGAGSRVLVQLYEGRNPCHLRRTTASSSCRAFLCQVQPIVAAVAGMT
jgi:hypothetical protein